MKILYCWILINEIEDAEDKLDKCLEKGLIKFLHEKYNPTFIVLDSNIEAVKEILGDYYNQANETNLIELIKEDFKIQLDNADQYFSKDKIIEIYNSSCPYDTIKDALKEII